jgi:hypothetical protein
VRDRAWRVARVQEVAGDRTVLQVEALDGCEPRRLSVVSPPEEIVPLGPEAPALDAACFDSFPAWSRLHRLIAASAVRETGVLSGARFGRVQIEAYQLAPALRLLAKPRPSLLVADDVGLGKTIEAGLALLELMARGRASRVLVVVPPGLLDQWREELHEKFGLAFTLIENATGLARVGFYPVFEGKHVEQFLVGVKPVWWWLCVSQANAKYGCRPRADPTLVFRQIASNTNEKTCIAAVLPECSSASNTPSGMILAHVGADAAACVLNSVVFDWAMRLRAATSHVTFSYLRPLPVPPAEVVNRLPCIPTQLAWERGIEHVMDDEALWPELWAANRAVAEAYGLGPDDFAHVLASFPVFARKRPGFHAFLLERLEEWRAEAARRP